MATNKKPKKKTKPTGFIKAIIKATSGLLGGTVKAIDNRQERMDKVLGTTTKRKPKKKSNRR